MTNSEINNKAVIYTRIAGSTGQADKNENISNQVKKCKEYAKNHGLEIDHVFSDVGVAGSTPLEKREELKKAVAHCKSNKIGTIVVSHYERISRNLASYLEIKIRLGDKNIKILPELSPEDMHLFSMSSAINSFNKEEKDKRIK